jgi:hypothetical protein
MRVRRAILKKSGYCYGLEFGEGRTFSPLWWLHWLVLMCPRPRDAAATAEDRIRQLEEVVEQLESRARFAPKAGLQQLKRKSRTSYSVPIDLGPLSILMSCFQRAAHRLHGQRDEPRGGARRAR